MSEVMLCAALPGGDLERLMRRWGIEVRRVDPGLPIPGSHWGAPEAGMLAGVLYVRDDTPVHSALHEGCHLICMGPERRSVVDTDAEGDEIEECAVCYLQIVLADELDGVGSDRLMRDMDEWGYSFRLGSTRAWFENDAEDGRRWLEQRGLLRAGQPAVPPVDAGVDAASSGTGDGTSIDATA